MDVGIQMVFASYGWDNISDAQVWDEELRLARLYAREVLPVLKGWGAPAAAATK